MINDSNIGIVDLFDYTVRNKPELVKEIIQKHIDDNNQDILFATLVQWVKAYLPKNGEDAQKLVIIEKQLKREFSNYDEAYYPLQILNVAIRIKLGDSNAPLDLPIELRNLLKDEYHDK